MKKILGIILAVMMLTMTGCGGTNDTGTKKIGVLIPKTNSDRWIRDGETFKEEFEKRGYEVEVLNAQDDVETQIEQIKEMISKDVDVMIIGAVDTLALEDVLIGAEEKKIPVISFDKLIMNSNAISYFVAFDSEFVGRTYGEYIEKEFGLKDGKGGYNVEFFAGSIDDSNAKLIHESLLKVLQPYIDNEQLKVPSGQTKFNNTDTYRWLKQESYRRMNEFMTNIYNDGTELDAVICASDCVADGVISSLIAKNYGNGESWPVITGQDANISAYKYIMADKQALTMLKDTHLLAPKCIEIVDALMQGKTPDTKDATIYNNGNVDVPSYLYTPVVITKDNVKEVLLDSGFYTAEQVGDKE
ncbi:MAG: sugar-binding protein [Selenomonadaceae bacterium]|nr:sugar-binding protein [Selenomonadaceae bacterium]